MQSRTPLRVGLIWHGSVLSERLFLRPTRVTLGPTHRATFLVPRHSALPRRFAILKPRRDGYRLVLGPSMKGELMLGGTRTSVASLLAQGVNRRGQRKIEVHPGDSGTIELASGRSLRLCFEFTTPPPLLPRKSQLDPLIVRAMASMALLHVALLAAALLSWKPAVRFPPIEITADRFAKYFPQPKEPKRGPGRKEVAENETKEEEGQRKRLKGEEGKLGRADAKAKETILPKGKEDVLREKVGTKGLLGLMKTGAASGSGLGKLLAVDPSNDLDRAVAGLKGATIVAGRGSGGFSTRGTGKGGGGTGEGGSIYGTGDIDTGGSGTRGRGKGGPALAARKEREVTLDMRPGSSDTDGSLSREQVHRVVQAHRASIKYCYEKEIQRHPDLSGKIEIAWMIAPSGIVERASVHSSTMSSPAVESCIVRQVKQWQFPKASGSTGVRFPFFFKGGR